MIQRNYFVVNKPQCLDQAITKSVEYDFKKNVVSE